MSNLVTQFCNEEKINNHFSESFVVCGLRIGRYREINIDLMKLCEYSRPMSLWSDVIFTKNVSQVSALRPNGPLVIHPFFHNVLPNNQLY